MLTSEAVQERGRADHIACCAQFDDKYLLFYFFVILAIHAMHAFFFMRGARYVSTKITAIVFYDHRLNFHATLTSRRKNVATASPVSPLATRALASSNDSCVGVSN